MELNGREYERYQQLMADMAKREVKHSPEDEAEVLRLHREGMAPYKIAKQIDGVSKYTVDRILRRSGLR